MPGATYPTVRQPAYQAIASQPTQWQTAPPATVRGAMADPPKKFVLPSPTALGVSADLKVPAPTVDWKQIQARMERLNVLRYQKERLSGGGVQVTMLLPTNDPTRGQPVE